MTLGLDVDGAYGVDGELGAGFEFVLGGDLAENLLNLLLFPINSDRVTEYK